MADDEKTAEEEVTEVAAEAEPAAEAPAADEAPVAEAPAADETPKAKRAPAKKAAAPAAEAKPKPKRTTRPKVAKKEVVKERGEYKRVPRPVREQGMRKERRGLVVSASPDKTIVVRIDSAKPHPKYKKIVRRSNKLHAHDEENTAGVGDTVRIVECRPLSKTKNWRLVEIVERAR